MFRPPFPSLTGRRPRRLAQTSISSGLERPPYMHSAVTVSALEAGKHVFCQARMANDRAEAEEMPWQPSAPRSQASDYVVPRRPTVCAAIAL